MASPLKPLSKKQIEHWRGIFISMGIPLASFMSDAQITKLIRKMETRLEEKKSPFLEWTIKIRTYEDNGISFDKLDVEPKKIKATTDTIVLTCAGLFNRHPKIEAILVDVPGTMISHIVERKDLKGYGEGRFEQSPGQSGQTEPEQDKS